MSHSFGSKLPISNELDDAATLFLKPELQDAWKNWYGNRKEAIAESIDEEADEQEEISVPDEREEDVSDKRDIRKEEQDMRLEYKIRAERPSSNKMGII